jgi:tetratricopeptide (TPR) repeat protein
MEHFLKQSKIYKVGRLMFGEKDSSGRAFKRLTDFERMNESGSTQEMEIQAFENKLRNDPRDVSALIGLAGVYYAQGLFENAAENTRKAIAFEPGNGWYYLYLFWDYVFLREYDKAVEAQKKALAVNPQLKAEISARIEDTKRMFRSRGAVSDRFYLSDQYALIGDYAEALRVCRDALQRDPFYVEYYDKMAFYEHVLNNDGTVRTGGNVTDGAHKPWAFIDEAAGRWNRADGYALFYRLLKYDLEKALVLTEGRDMKIILENMGSTFQQQAVIGKVCSELKIPLVDLYSVFNGAGVQSRFFHPTLTSRLSAEGNERAAEEISRILEKEGVFDEYR